MNANKSAALTFNCPPASGKLLYDIVKYDTVEDMIVKRASYEDLLSAHLAAGASRFSDAVENLQIRLKILNTNIGLATS